MFALCLNAYLQTQSNSLVGPLSEGGGPKRTRGTVKYRGTL